MLLNGTTSVAQKPQPRTMSKMRHETIDVSPQTAAEWLKKNAVNRNVSTHKVNQFAWDMANGRWDFTEESIAFDADQNLVNGQHRLSAVVKSGATIRFTVAFNAPDIWTTRDRGHGRRAGDFLQWSDGSHASGIRVTAILNCMAFLTTGKQSQVSHAYLQELLEENEAGLRWVMSLTDAKVPSPVKAAMLFAYRVDPRRVEAFAEGYVSGAGLEPGSPVLSLRNSEYGRKYGNISDKLAAMRRTLGALRAFIRGRSMSRVEAAPGGEEYFRERRSGK